MWSLAGVVLFGLAAVNGFIALSVTGDFARALDTTFTQAVALLALIVATRRLDK